MKWEDADKVRFAQTEPSPYIIHCLCFSQYCRSMGTHLAEINDMTEQAFVSDLIKSSTLPSGIEYQGYIGLDSVGQAEEADHAWDISTQIHRYALLCCHASALSQHFIVNGKRG